MITLPEVFAATFIIALTLWALVGAIHLARVIRRVLDDRATNKAIADLRRRIQNYYAHGYDFGTKAYLIRRVEETCGVTVEVIDDGPGLVKIAIPGKVSRAKVRQVEAAVREHMPVTGADVSFSWTDKEIET